MLFWLTCCVRDVIGNDSRGGHEYGRRRWEQSMIKKTILGGTVIAVAFGSAFAAQARETRPAFLALSTAAAPAAAAAAPGQDAGSTSSTTTASKSPKKALLIGGGVIVAGGLIAIIASGGDDDSSPN